MRPFALLALTLAVVLSPPLAGQSIHPGGPTDGGVRATCDLPPAEHLRNVGGSDGSGLCVFTSCEVACRWQSSSLAGFQKWMTGKPGGGWPEKLDAMIVQFCREMKREIPFYAQHTGGDESFLELALHTGRMPCVTYCGQDDFYKDRFGRPAIIAHMVDLAHLDQEHAAIIDNNRPGEWVWMSRKDFLSRWRGNNGGWAVVFLDPPPPPYVLLPPGPMQSFDQLCPGGVCPPPGGEFVWVNGHGWLKVVQPAPPAAPPVAPTPPAKLAEKPAEKAQEKPAEKGTEPVGEEAKNYGVDASKVHSGKRWYLNGAPADRDEAMRAVAGPGLMDDSSRWFLVCVGDEAQRAAFKAAVSLLDAPTRDKLHPRIYSPSDWQVSQFDLPAGVSIRKPSVGRVGAEGGRLAGDVSPDTVRRFVADSLSPKPVPQPMPPPPPTPEPQPQPEPTPAPPKSDPTHWLLAAAVLAALMLFFRRK